MRGLIMVSEKPEPGRPHQGEGHLFSIRFERFPELHAGDQFGFQTHDGKIVVKGLIIHARTFVGLKDGEPWWTLHCVPYMFRAGFSVIRDKELASLQRRHKPVGPITKQPYI